MTDYWTYEIKLQKGSGAYDFNDRFRLLCELIKNLRLPVTGFPVSTQGLDSATLYLLEDDRMDLLENAFDSLRFKVLTKTRGTRQLSSSTWTP